MSNLFQNVSFVGWETDPLGCCQRLEQLCMKKTDSPYCELLLVVPDTETLKAIKFENGQAQFRLLSSPSCASEWTSTRKGTNRIVEQCQGGNKLWFSEWKPFGQCLSFLSLKIATAANDLWGILTLAHTEAYHYTDEAIMAVHELVHGFVTVARTEFLQDLCAAIYRVKSGRSLQHTFQAMKRLVSCHSPAKCVSLAVISSDEKKAAILTGLGRDLHERPATENILEFMEEDVIGGLKSTESEDATEIFVPSLYKTTDRKIPSDLKYCLPQSHPGQVLFLCLPMSMPRMRNNTQTFQTLGSDLIPGRERSRLVGVLYLRGGSRHSFKDTKQQLQSMLAAFAVLLRNKITDTDETISRLAIAAGGRCEEPTLKLPEGIRSAITARPRSQILDQIRYSKSQDLGDVKLVELVSDQSSEGIVIKGWLRNKKICAKIVPSLGSQVTSQSSLRLDFDICLSKNHRNLTKAHAKYICISSEKLFTQMIKMDGAKFRQVEAALSAKRTDHLESSWDVLVMEYCEKGTLHSLIHEGQGFIKPGGGIEMKPLLLTLIEMARALEYLHFEGIIHGDFKPQNVLLQSCPISESDPRGWYVKVADFGRSQISDRYKAHYPRGTPMYSPPEHFDLNQSNLSKAQVGEKADVFSFAVSTCEMITSRPPFEDIRDRITLMSRVKTGHRPEIPECCPDRLRHLLDRMWHQNPTERPSFTSIVYELEAIVDSL